MKIIVACEGLGVSPHAVHCASFMCYTVERGIIADCRNLPNPGLSAEDTAQMFIDLGVGTIITGGIDYDFANMLCHAGIEVVAGVEGSAREVLEAYINHTLIGADELCHTLPSTTTRKKQKSTMRSRSWKRTSSQRTRKEAKN